MTEINSKQFQLLIEKRKPLGKFFLKENRIYIGIDNTRGEAFTEEFQSIAALKLWFDGGSHVC